MESRAGSMLANLGRGPISAFTKLLGSSIGVTGLTTVIVKVLRGYPRIVPSFRNGTIQALLRTKPAMYAGAPRSRRCWRDSAEVAGAGASWSVEASIRPV